ncbi:MAG TPA: prepilin-type N-terminal cleavage/methylation domain-containing protein [Clostridia bacterium]|nr:prepilin-type N-terminal cleavage/methylation domain-containing protein [Clostridia bacterium]
MKSQIASAWVGTERKSRCGVRAFSLVEILVTVALLSFIILGLLAMFHQTQRAFRSGIAQTDVLESGRAVTHMIVRELEQMTPCHLPHLTNNGTVYYATNFFAEPSYGFLNPLIQDLPGSDATRTNRVQRFFFLRKENQDWDGVGYVVLPEYVEAGAGALYRFRSSPALSREPRMLSSEFEAAVQTAVDRLERNPPLPLTNLPLYRVADGVAHMRVRAIAANGFPITHYNNAPGFWFHQPGREDLLFAQMRNVAVFGGYSDPVQVACYCVSNVVPASVELELGLLEPQILRRFRALGNQAAQREYLSNRVAYVHLFRQQIPIRNVDIKAYQ